MPTSSAVRAFAIDPPAYLPPPPGARVVDDARFHLTVSEDGTRATVCRLAGDVREIHPAVVERAPAARVVWITDGSQEAELRALGCRDQNPPLTSYITALATEDAPPAVEGVEVRRVETKADSTAALAVFERGWGVSRPPGGPVVEWLAYVDGAPVAWAGAHVGPVGLFLTGGVTVPEARGRGAYRALVRARWDDAVRRGTPALVVHAEEASRRVLVRIGFQTVSPIVELISEPAC